MFRSPSVTSLTPGIVAIAALLGALGCSPDGPNDIPATFNYDQLVESDGVGELSLELMHRTPLEFSVSSMVNWHSDTSVALVESHEQRGVILGLDGRVLSHFGRKGSGPGELTGGIQMLPGRQGGAAVVDLALNRITLFNADASPSSTILVSGRPIKLLDFGEETVTVLVHGSAGTSTANTVTQYSSRTGEKIDEFNLDVINAELGSFGNGTTPGIAVIASGDSSDIYIANPFEYRLIHVSGDLALRSSIQVPGVAPLHLSEEAIAERTEGALRGLEGVSGTVRSQAAQALETTLSAQQPHFGPYSLAASAGRAFVARRLPSGRASVIDVFEDGSFLGSFAFPLAIQGIDASAHQLAFIASPDPFGPDHEQTLFTYRLIQ